MSIKRILFVIAAVIFFLAWLVAIGTITSDSDPLGFQALIALGLAFVAAGAAVDR